MLNTSYIYDTLTDIYVSFMSLSEVRSSCICKYYWITLNVTCGVNDCHFNKNSRQKSEWLCRGSRPPKERFTPRYDASLSDMGRCAVHHKITVDDIDLKQETRNANLAPTCLNLCYSTVNPKTKI
jgi:hypothetical protein